MSATSYIIKGGSVVLPNRVARQDILIEDGFISKIGDHLEGAPCEYAKGQFILPGFIDIHNHGAAGFDFSFGQYHLEGDTFSTKLHDFEVGLEHALNYYLSRGVTKVYLTSMAAPVDKLAQAFANLDQFLTKHPNYQALVGGINVEGTFLKDPAYAGAQNPAFFYQLDPQIIDELQSASGQRIKVINIPPEHGKTALPLIENLSSQNIVVAAGHTSCYGDELEDAVHAGLSLAVHFLNGPARCSYKSFHKGGAQEMMLRSDQMYLEIIADGYHVDPAYFRDVLARKGTEKIIIITDSMFANGLNNLEQFSLFGLKGAVSNNREFLKMSGSEDTLFGSVLSSNRAFSNVTKWLQNTTVGVWNRHHESLSFEQAMMAASQMCSVNPSRLLKMNARTETEPATGCLRPGNVADLVIGYWTDDLFLPSRTIVGGSTMWTSTPP